MKQAKSFKKVCRQTALGIAAATASALIFAALLGWAVTAEWLPVSAAKTMLTIVSTISVFAACYLTAKKVQQSRLVVSLVVALAYMLLMVLFQLMDGPIQIDLRMLAPILAAVAAGLFASRKVRQRR